MLAAAFVFKLVVLLQLTGHPLTAPDSGLDTTAYAELARQVVGGNLGLGPGLYFVSPLYIYFLAALLAVFDSFTFVKVVQILLGTGAIGFMFFTTRAWFGERAALITAGLASVTGLFTFYEVLILQSSIDVFLTSAALYLLCRALLPRSVGVQFVLFAGVAFGLQALNRPNVLIAVVGVALVMVILLRRIKPAALLIAGLLIGIAPVAIRNVVVARQFSLVSSHGGLNFYIGNSESATGFYRLVPGVRPSIAGQAADTRRVAERTVGRPVTDTEASDYFFNLGWTWIKTHPADALALFAKKFAFAFHAQTLPLPHSYPFFAYDEGTALRFYFIGPWLLVPLGLVGLIGGAIRTRSREFIAWAAFVPAYAGAIAIFFIAERYRLPLLVPMAIGSGAALDFAWVKVRERRWMDLALPAAAVIALAGAVNYRAKLDDGRWIEGLRLAERLVILGRYDEAEQRAQWLETHHRQRPGAGMHGVGEQLLSMGKTDLALPYLRRGHEANPDDARQDYSYGQVLLKSGRAAEAVPHLKHGFESGLEIPGGGIDYALALKETGDTAGTIATVRRIQPPPDADHEGWLRLGRLAMGAKAPGVAEPFFRRAVEMAPNVAAARQQYGLNLLLLERFDAAAAELAAANRLDPRDADTLAHLAFCEAKLGRIVEARAHVTSALALDPAQPLARQLQAMLR